MNTNLTFVLMELQKLTEALPGSDKLLLQSDQNGLDCQFLAGGLVLRKVPVRSKALVAALQHAGVLGILEGAAYTAFRESFGGFALHVKATVLYEELTANQPSYQSELQNSQVA